MCARLGFIDDEEHLAATRIQLEAVFFDSGRCWVGCSSQRFSEIEAVCSEGFGCRVSLNFV